MSIDPYPYNSFSGYFINKNPLPTKYDSGETVETVEMARDGLNRILRIKERTELKKCVMRGSGGL